ncbi:Uncharacterized conserved protein YndB, AHSA1/START domain [Nocardioides alpinus]|uniref:SRPBCC family protein n=1 Tax=Nocardioides alpinus TaxID=748909 RepID=A0A1I1AWU1_9ACTN|nr:SRPBCC family protein [Nocardioides alpinus]PKH40975.1 SRPBCC family protein [Nocardioides alpinus]SFB42524.1 Uncharacterized conserved protein YndB, AHSA1/START domain [Nocardioides alpinus]
MTRPMTVSASTVVSATPDAIYAQVADPSQMPRWSPENVAGDVPAPGSPLSVGDAFVGTNRRGRASWSTRCVVTRAEPGREFAFKVRQIGLRSPRLTSRVATWTYTFEPVAGGTRVTETWTDDRRWPDVIAAAFDKVATGGQHFHQFQQRNIATTLQRLKADLES